MNQDTSTYQDLAQEVDQEDINEHGDGRPEQSCPLASLDANLVIYYFSLYPLILQEEYTSSSHISEGLTLQEIKRNNKARAP